LTQSQKSYTGRTDLPNASSRFSACFVGLKCPLPFFFVFFCFVFFQWFLNFNADFDRIFPHFFRIFPHFFRIFPHFFGFAQTAFPPPLDWEQEKIMQHPFLHVYACMANECP
jgi:hypothetical protein